MAQTTTDVVGSAGWQRATLGCNPTRQTRSWNVVLNVSSALVIRWRKDLRSWCPRSMYRLRAIVNIRWFRLPSSEGRLTMDWFVEVGLNESELRGDLVRSQQHQSSQKGSEV